MLSHRWILAAAVLSASVGCTGSKPSSSAQTRQPSSEVAQTGAGVVLGQAPEVNLVDMEGNTFSLSSLWQEQGVYLVFYRGNW